MTNKSLNVGLFVTCPVDLFRPSIGFATVKLLEQANCRVSVPSQSCCGQVAFNNGDPKSAVKLAWQVIETFDEFDYVVLPSGSCGGTIKTHYPELFSEDPRLERVKAFCSKVHELTMFLADVLNYKPEGFNCDLHDKNITYHDSCAGLRELNIKAQPRQLLSEFSNVNLNEMQDTDECCGFGGTFCIKFPEVSNKMVTNKTSRIREANAELILGGDLSCLMNIAGKLHRQQSENPEQKKIEVRHIAEILAGDLTTPAIGESGLLNE